MSGTFECDDTRGEYWKYYGGGRVIQIGVGGMDGCSVDTSDLTVKSGDKLDMFTRMEILAEFLRYMSGPRDGTAKLTLTIVKPYIPTSKQLIELDHVVCVDDFVRTEGQLDGTSTRLVWQRDVGPRK